ncbi:hypothetical protein MUB16_35440 [Priestia sp. OVL9]|nr:hypothetical protein [Priestia sp. OVL9]
MEFTYKNEILDLQSFLPIFNEIKEKNPDMGANIEHSLKAAVKESHNLLKNAQSRDQAHLALIKEQMYIQAQSSQYLSITDEITQKKNALLEFKPKVYHEFMDEIESIIREYFKEKSENICKEIEEDGAWYSGLRDSAKKGGGSLLNVAMDGINGVSKGISKKKLFNENHMLDSKTIVEKLLEKHLDNKEISYDISNMFTAATKKYEKSGLNILRLINQI